MFVNNYAVLDTPNEATRSIGVTGILMDDERITLSLVNAGIFNKYNGLLFSGYSSGVDLPSTDVFLPDLPEDLFTEIMESGVLVIDFGTGTQIFFPPDKIELEKSFSH